MYKLLTIAILLVCVGNAYSMTGNKLKEELNEAISAEQGRKDFNRLSAGHGLGYVEGISNFLNGMSFTCMLPGGSVGQVVTVVFNYLNDHPEELNGEATVLVSRALVNAFPCKK